MMEEDASNLGLNSLDSALYSDDTNTTVALSNLKAEDAKTLTEQWESASTNFLEYSTGRSGEKYDPAKEEEFKNFVPAWMFERTMSDLQDQTFPDPNAFAAPILNKNVGDNPAPFANWDRHQNSERNAAYTERESSHHVDLFTGQIRENYPELDDDEYEMLAVATHLSEAGEIEFDDVVAGLDSYASAYAHAEGLTDDSIKSVFGHMKGGIVEREAKRQLDTDHWVEARKMAIQGINVEKSLGLKAILKDEGSMRKAQVQRLARDHTFATYGENINRAREVIQQLAAGIDEEGAVGETKNRSRMSWGLLDLSEKDMRQTVELVLEIAALESEKVDGSMSKMATNFQKAVGGSGEDIMTSSVKRGTTLKRRWNLLVPEKYEWDKTDAEVKGEKHRELMQILRQARNTYRDSEAEGFWESVGSGITSNVHYFAMFAMPFGIGKSAMAMDMAAKADEQLRLEYPDMNPDLRWELSGTVGVLQMFTENIQMGWVTKGFPSVTKLIGGTGAKRTAGVLAARLLAANASEYGEEVVQSATKTLMHKVWHEVGVDIPDVNQKDWDDNFWYWEDGDMIPFWDADIFTSLVGLSALGVGGRAVYEKFGAKEVKKQLADVDRLMLIGLPRSEAEAIAETNKVDQTKAFQQYQDAVNSKDKGERRGHMKEARLDGAATRVLEKDVALAEKAVKENGTKSERDTLKYNAARLEYTNKFSAHMEEVEGGGFELIYPEADIRPTETYETRALAEEALLQHQQEVDESFTKETAEQVQAVEGVELAAEFIRGQHAKAGVKAEILTNEDIRQIKEFADESAANMQLALDRVQHSLLEQGFSRPAEVGDFDNFVIQAEVKLREDARGYLERVAKGAKPNAVLEDAAEGFLGVQIAQGVVTKGWVKQQLFDYQKHTGDVRVEVKSPEEISDLRMKEVFSDLALGNAFNAAADGKFGKLSAFIRAFRHYVRGIMTAALNLQKLSKDGVIAPDFQILLDQSVGLNMDEQIKRQTVEAQEGILDELSQSITPQDASFSIAPAFYSKMEDVLDKKIQGKQATPEQIKSIIDPSKGSGVKAEEIKWTGVIQKIDQLAADNNGKVPKAELMDWLKNDAAVEFEEVVMGDGGNKQWTQEDIDSLEQEARRTRNFDAYEQAVLEYEDQQLGTNANDTGNETQYAEYQVPNGENYKETVLTMPVKGASDKSKVGEYYDNFIRKGGEPSFSELSIYEQQEVVDTTPSQVFNRVESNYTSSHFPDIPNYVAHMRTNEREDSTGDEGLFIEEIQSDRHQAARKQGYKEDVNYDFEANREKQRAAVKDMEEAEKLLTWEHEGKTVRADGYLSVKYKEVSTDPWTEITFDRRRQAEALGLTEERGDAYMSYFVFKGERDALAREAAAARTSGIPDAPFRKDWHLQMFKRGLRDAIAAGKDWIGWTVGQTQNERYDLSKQVKEVVVPMINKDGSRSVRVEVKENSSSIKMMVDKNAIVTGQYSNAWQFNGKKLDEVLGKDVAEKIMNLTEPTTLTGNDLAVGGSGMKGFYDNMLPTAVQKYVKQWGAKVEDGKLTTRGFDPAEETEFVIRDQNGNEAAGITSMNRAPSRIAQLDRDRPQDAPHSVEPRSAVKDVPFHKVAITDAMRESIEEIGQTSFSITPAQDATYMDAVESGDVETQQRMVDEAARKAGYDSPKVYHVTNKKFNTFDSTYSSEGMLGRGFYFADNVKDVDFLNRKHVMPAFLKVEKPLVFYGDDYNEIKDQYGLTKTTDIIKKGVSLGFDGVIAEYGDGNQHVVFSPNQIKSADPVTKDADGNVIPLSQRFDPSRDEISFSIGSAQDADYLGFQIPSDFMTDAELKALAKSNDPNKKAKLMAEDAKRVAWEESRWDERVARMSDKGNLADRPKLPFADTKDKKFIRFGDIPEGGRSQIGGDKFSFLDDGDTLEEGVSVFPATYNAERNLWEIDKKSLRDSGYASFDQLVAEQQEYSIVADSGGSYTDDTHIRTINKTQKNKNIRPIYLVTGNEVGIGTDGEPTLENIKTLDTVNSQDLLLEGYFDPAKDLDPKTTPSAFDAGRDEISMSISPASDAVLMKINELARDPDTRLEIYRQMAVKVKQAQSAMVGEDDTTDAIVSNMKTIEAIISVLPMEIRYKAGRAAAMTKFTTVEQGMKYLVKRLDYVDTLLEEYLRKDLDSRVRRGIRASQPAAKYKASATGRSKIGDEARTVVGADGEIDFRYIGHRIGIAAAKAIIKNPQQAQAAAAEERAKIDENTTVAKQQEYEDVAYTYELFADIKNADSNRLTMMLDLLKTNWDEGRKGWRRELGMRKDWKVARKSAIIKGLLGKDYYESDAERARGKDLKSSWVANTARETTSIYHMLDFLREDMMGTPAAKFFKDMADDLRRASNKFDMEQINHRKMMKKAFSDIFQFKGTNKTARVQARIHDMSKGVEWGNKVTHSIMYDHEIKANKKQMEAAYDELAANEEQETVFLRDQEVTRAEFDEIYSEYLANFDIDVLEGFDKPSERKVFTHSVRRNTGKRETVGLMSQLDLLKDWLSVQQSDIKMRYEQSGYDEKYRSQLDDVLDEDTKRMGLWMQDILRQGTPATEALHRSEYGLAMATVMNYFPAVFQHKYSDTDSRLQIEGVDVAGVSKRPSSHMMRVNHKSAPERQNAVNTFNHHLMQNAYWMTHAEVLRKWGGILRDTQVQDVILRTKGRGFLSNLNSTFDNLEDQGAKVAQAQIESDVLWRNIGKGLSLGVLGLKISSTFKNALAGANVLYTRDWTDLAKTLTSGELIEAGKELYASDTFQRRLEMGASVATRYALQGSASSNIVFATSTRMAELGIQPINVFDTGTNLTMAMAYVAEKQSLRKTNPNMSEADIKAQALDYVDDMMARYAQPADRMSKSLMENTRPVLGKFLVLFQSEARKYLVINALAGRKLLTGKGVQSRKLAAQQMLVSNLVVTGGLHLIEAAFSALFRNYGEGDDPEEKFLNEFFDGKKFLAALIADQLAGVPLFGGAWTMGVNKLMGEKVFTSTSNPMVRSIGGAATLLTSAAKMDENSASENADIILKSFQSFFAMMPQTAVIAQTSNVARDALGLLNNTFFQGLTEADTFDLYSKRLRKSASDVTARFKEEKNNAKESGDKMLLRQIDAEIKQEKIDRAYDILFELPEPKRVEYLQRQAEMEKPHIPKYMIRAFSSL